MVNMSAMPTLHRESGYEYRFFSADRDEPPHVHVRGNGGSAKFWLPTLELAASRGYNERQLRQILAIARPRRHDFLDKWHEFFD
jgi:hypothetical protein